MHHPTWGFLCLSALLAAAAALPATLVDEIKSSELTHNKVKRAHSDLRFAEEETVRDVPFITKPTAAKRGTFLKNPSPEQQALNEWEQEQRALYQDPEALASIQSTLFSNAAENPFDDKTIAEYEKGLRYGTNMDKLDEALENAVLKSEIYGEPAAINHYRYYGESRRRRRRRDASPIRGKRQTELTPDEMLTILTLYDRALQPKPLGGDGLEQQEGDESWLDGPVYPHSPNDVGPPYEQRASGRWGGVSDGRGRRFMVAKKRGDPTRELRYLNGPSKNDFYTLSQLLSNQREPNVPLYRRLVL